jgi:hypothetical protein
MYRQFFYMRDFSRYNAAMNVFLLLGGIISLIGTIPYTLDTIKGKTKPRVASWLMWAMLTGVAAAASLSAGHVSAAVLATCMTVSCAAVAILAFWKNSQVVFSKFDNTCLFASLSGVVLWQVFNSPELAVLAVVAIDAIASLPTLRHAYRAPEEETMFEFLMAGVASVITIVAATDFSSTAVAYPLYIIIFDFIVVYLLVRGRRRQAKGL